ncbi:hypothetical protein V5799_018319 [Amblyomma americanum]|uniref:Uncharacterized protein n=1 Tax=Amblyomma americanum TaxID=6943 RepID=A0AAQ4EZV5_AMBAM
MEWCCSLARRYAQGVGCIVVRQYCGAVSVHTGDLAVGRPFPNLLSFLSEWSVFLKLNKTKSRRQACHVW